MCLYSMITKACNRFFMVIQTILKARDASDEQYAYLTFGRCVDRTRVHSSGSPRHGRNEHDTAGMASLAYALSSSFSTVLCPSSQQRVC
mgnify:FL=1